MSCRRSKPSSPVAPSKVSQSDPVLNQKPFLAVHITQHAKVTDNLASEPFVVFFIETETNIADFKTERRSPNGSFLWLLFLCFSSSFLSLL